MRGALLVMEPIGRYVLLPLVLAGLFTGIIQSVGTTWGLIRHYWVLYKLVIAVVSTIVLLLFITSTLDPLTSAAANPTAPLEELRALAGTPKDHALLALAGLLMATTLAVYKPRAMTPYGQRKQDQQHSLQRQRRAEVTAALTPAAAQPRPGGHNG